MTRLAQLLHLDDGEFPELRAAIEARPLPVAAVPKPLGWGSAMLSYLRSQDAADHKLGMTRPSAPVAPRPIVLTDWSARIARDWKHVEARFDNLAVAYVREVTRNCDVDQYAVYTATAPPLSGVVELKCSQIVDWRQALRIHAEAELALYGTKAEVAK